MLRVTPVTNTKDFNSIKRSLKLDHRNESGDPGYYSVKFPGDDIHAEMTSTIRCGIHRYSKTRASRALHLLIDGTSGVFHKGGAGPDSDISVDPATGIIRGSVLLLNDYSTRYGGLKAHYYGELEPGARSFRVWSGKSWKPAGATQAQGKKIGLGIVYPTSTSEVTLKLCVSHVSVDNAKGNFEAEARGKSFDEIRAEARKVWEQVLDKIDIKVADQNTRTVFYTALYHSFLMPTNFTDVNREYRGVDKQVRRAEDFTYHTDLSIWDTFRTTHPLYTLIAPGIQRDTMRSLLEMGKVIGVLPRWPSGTADTGDMIGSPANFLFAESHAKGIRDFDAKLAVDLMLGEATIQTHFGRSSREGSCIQYGYCPDDLTEFSVSRTLEHAWGDAAAADLATAIGENHAARVLREKSLAYRELWDPQTRFFRPKDSKGRFLEYAPDVVSWVMNSGKNTGPYAEGSGHHWRYYVPHQVDDLIQLLGGPAKFVRELDTFFKGAPAKRNRFIPPYMYWHGNEHNIHAAYLFNDAGRPELTQKWVRWALRTQYANSPDGLAGNDDAGTLSAWYIFSALGFYPQAGTDRYWIGSPLVEQATLDLGEGSRLGIIVHGQEPKNIYIQSVMLNGTRLCKPLLRHAELKDAKLEFTLGPAPAPQGGFDCSSSNL